MTIGDVGGRGRGAGVGEAGVDQALAETALGRRRRVREQGAQCGGSALGETDDAPARDQDPAAAVEADRRVEHEPHKERPPSSGKLPPVAPALCGPASQAISAATSSGSTSRPSACWAANSSPDSRP